MSAKLLVFSVFDSKAEVYGTPMFFPTRGIALRQFTDEANRAESAIKKHPEDYTLFYIGEYDPDKGLLTPANTNSSMGVAIEFINQEH